jgi:hypothetical protein
MDSHIGTSKGLLTPFPRFPKSFPVQSSSFLSFLTAGQNYFGGLCRLLTFHVTTRSKTRGLFFRWVRSNRSAASRFLGHSRTSFSNLRHATLTRSARDAQSRDFIKGGAPELESMIMHTGVRAERLPADPALVSTTLPPRGLVETVTDNASGSGFSRPRASPVWTAETLHSSRTLSRVDLMASN